MTERPVPSGATRGAVDLAGLHAADTPAAGAASGGDNALHLVATDATFNDIVTRSVRVPMVLVVVSTRVPESVVFLTNVLSIARDFGGRFQVVSVDVDTNPGLLRALQVQSVPVTMGLVKGQAVPMFAGPVADEELRAIFEELLGLAVQQGVTGRVEVSAEPAAGAEAAEELPPLHQEAFDAIERGDLAGASAAYEKALADNPKDEEAEIGLAQVRLMERTAGVDLAAARTAAAERPDDVDAQVVVADLDLLGGHVEDAFTRLIDVVRRSSGAEREQARTHLLGLFVLVGSGDERVRKARTALMSALF